MAAPKSPGPGHPDRPLQEEKQELTALALWKESARARRERLLKCEEQLVEVRRRKDHLARRLEDAHGEIRRLGQEVARMEGAAAQVARHEAKVRRLAVRSRQRGREITQRLEEEHRRADELHKQLEEERRRADGLDKRLEEERLRADELYKRLEEEPHRADELDKRLEEEAGARTRSKGLEAELSSQHEKFTELATVLRGTKIKVKRAERLKLDEEPLKQVLPLRRQRFPPAGLRAGALARHERLATTSAAYRAYLDGDFTGLSQSMVELEGLQWWLPLSPKQADRPERVLKHGLPFASMLQTRELAIGGAMVDIGANIGKTCIPRVLLGDAQEVYAAEPDPDNYACLVRNVFENNVKGFVLPDHCAIGSRNGTIRLGQAGKFTSQSVLADAALVGNYLEVPCYTLDTWLDRLAVDLDYVRFVKVDTNGFELEVIRGAQALLARRLAAWQFEIAPECLATYGVALDTLVDELAKSFTHFVDLSRRALGARIRPVNQLKASLEYLANMPRTGKAPVTDVLLYWGTPD